MLHPGNSECIMEGIKKKLNVLKDEKDKAIERADTAEDEKKQAIERAEAVSIIVQLPI